MQKNIPVSAFMFVLFSAAAFAQSDSSGADTRHFRAWAVSAEVGMNSLSSLVGPVVSYYPMPRMALDMGVGLSSSGLRPGLRTRYLFTPGEKTSFFGGIGYKYALGSGGQEVKVQDPDTKTDLQITTEPTSFLDLMLGTEFLADNGFLVIANAGFSAQFGETPYIVKSGTLSEKGKKAFDTVFGSGIMLSVSLGKGF